MRTPLLAIALLAGLTQSVLAHEPRTGPHGGALVDAGAYHIEVVTKDANIEVFVSDAHDKALASTGYKALAILAVDGKSVRISLEPSSDGQKLAGTAPAPLGKKVKGAVQLTTPEGKTATGKIN
jgi:hypothetical protein